MKKLKKIYIISFSVLSFILIFGGIALFTAATDQNNNIAGGVVFIIFGAISSIPLIQAILNKKRNTESKPEETINIYTPKAEEFFDQDDTLVSEDMAEDYAQAEYAKENNSGLFVEPSKLLLLKIDSLSTSGIYFENVVCEIMKANGFNDVVTTSTTNDYGIDILAEKDGITYAVQCKCYSGTVGNKAVQEAFSGKNMYHRMIAVVVTNSTFSKSAIETAKATQVLLWDRNKLIDMIGNMNDDEVRTLVQSEI